MVAHQILRLSNHQDYVGLETYIQKEIELVTRDILNKKGEDRVEAVGKLSQLLQIQNLKKYVSNEVKRNGSNSNPG